MDCTKHGDTMKFDHSPGKKKVRILPHTSSGCLSNLEQKSNKSENIKIRPALDMDTGYIIQLSKRLFHNYGPYDRMVAEWLESGAATVIIAQINRQTAGFAMLGYPTSRFDYFYSPELLALAVTPEKQRRGIGKSLLKEIEKKAVETGTNRIFLHTEVKNFRARRLYSKNGYIPWEIKREFYPSGQDAVVMSKEISICNLTSY